MVVLSIQRGWADRSARRRPRCKRDLSGWRWRGFSWPDGWPCSAWQSNMHKRSLPPPHRRRSHRRPSIHRRHTPCLNRPRPPSRQDCQAPFRDPRGSRLRLEVHPARSLALIDGRLQRRRHPTSRKRTGADTALGVTVGTGAAEITPPAPRAFGRQIGSQLRPAVGECAVHSKPRTDVMPSGLLARIDAGAS
jgi:hypothetical protein